MKYLRFILVLGCTSFLFGGGVKVPSETDLVILKNGRVIKGTVLCSGSRNVVVLAGEQEETIPADQVKEIQKGKKTAETVSYLTGNVDGLEQIVGRGTFVPELAKVQPKKPAGKPAASADRKTGGDPFRGARKTSQPEGNTKIPSALIEQIRKNPALLNQLKNIKDPKKVDEFLKKNNILINKDIQNILKDLSRK